MLMRDVLPHCRVGMADGSAAELWISAATLVARRADCAQGDMVQVSSRGSEFRALYLNPDYVVSAEAC